MMLPRSSVKSRSNDGPSPRVPAVTADMLYDKAKDCVKKWIGLV